MTERWRAIPGHPGYEASTEGRIRGVERKVRCRNGFRSVRAKVLSPFPAKDTGYLQVNTAGRSRQSVHRLVALAWCPDHFEGAWVNHKNGVRDDNRASNLEWVTASANVQHGFRSNGRINPFKGVVSGAHPTAKAVVSTCLTTGAEQHYACASDAAREGFDSGGISRCCRGIWAKHGGREWRFA